MKVSISSPAIGSQKGMPLLSQNRQFQWFNNPTYIYSMVPTYAAMLLKDDGHHVYWDDGITEELSPGGYMQRLIKEQPELIAIETKTPVIKTHWKIVNDVKEALPQACVVLMGDHATALPQESMENCQVDYVLTGGDYDFLLRNLCRHLSRGEELEPGIWYRQNGAVRNTGRFELRHDLDGLPFIDRELTKWWLYSEKNGNYRQLPGTYTMVGRDCWWHKCSFCSWTTMYSNFRVRRPESLLDEIGMLIEKHAVKEVFDDTGTFPRGAWLETFCRGMIERGYHKKIRFGCNMRFGSLGQEQYNLMRRAGFRYVLFGVESANQKTLDRIDKGIKVSDIAEGCMMAKKAGLEPHLTVMVGYPWETREDALATVDLARGLFRRGYADTLQATIVIPYPGTPLFQWCKENGLLSTEDWDGYDMRQPVMKTSLSEDDVKDLMQCLYRTFFTPRYMIRKLTSVRSLNDLMFLWRGVRAVFGHLKDFSITRRSKR